MCDFRPEEAPGAVRVQGAESDTLASAVPLYDPFTEPVG